MRKDIEVARAADLGYLSSSAKVLFSDVSSLATMWERCCALSIVSMSKKLLKSVSVSGIFSLNEPLAMLAKVSRLEVMVASETGDVQWRPNTLVVGAPGQKGWDLKLCTENNAGKSCSTYIEVKVCNPNKDLAAMKADKIVHILDDHFARGGLTMLQVSLVASRRAFIIPHLSLDLLEFMFLNALHIGG